MPKKWMEGHRYYGSFQLGKIKLKGLLTKEFDLLIIGGGASGTGSALDATNSRLNVELIVSGNFALQSRN